uniref:Mucin-2-like n=1 Tax=Geotrypetes seraphini TaxID=260995 RepID=A0A6P8QCV2_GEOSA|nr:mucin-2-like [Geotrypetes seraphini]XP_033784607.1 mucin-2-like [Geotrypetes seraphini]
MLITVTPLQSGLLHPQAPPPLLPKPGKENLRLQRLQKKSAKKPVLAAPQPNTYRSTLSPVNEASPDLEYNGYTPPPKTPETPKYLTISLPPRYTKPVIHHVASPYSKQKSFTFTISEQRSLSEYIKLTPSSPISVVSKQRIPHVQLQQPPQGPRAESVVPNQAPKPTTGHSSSAIHHISAPKTPSSTTADLSTSDFEAPVQVTHVTEVHTQVSSVQTLRARTPTLERDEKNMTPNDEKRIPVSMAQPETSHSELPTKCLSSVVNTNDNTAATHEQVNTTTIFVFPPSPSSPASEIPRAATPKSKSDDARGSRPLTPSTPVPRLLTPNASVHRPVSPGTTFSRPAITNDKISESLTEITRSPTPKQDISAVVCMDEMCGTPTKTDKSVNSKIIHVPVHDTSPQSTANDDKSNISILPKAEPLMKSTEIKPSRTNLSGWSRLKKHLVVDPEEPEFPAPESDTPKPKEEEKKIEMVHEDSTIDDKTAKPKESRATKMWNAVLFQMMKESLKQAKEREETTKSGEMQIIKDERIFPFRCRLPLLLFAPRFDARKLKEAASRPLKKITALFDLGRLHHKATHEELKDFNRSASGWQNK